MSTAHLKRNVQPSSMNACWIRSPHSCDMLRLTLTCKRPATLSLNIDVMTSTAHDYEVCPRRDKRGVDLISDVLPFGRLWYTKPDDAIGYAMRYSRSHDAVIRVYDAAGNVIKTHKHKGNYKDLASWIFYKS